MKRLRSGAATGTTFVAALSLSMGSGCSFLFTDSPPARHTELPYFDCTSSRWAPNIDLAVAALYGIAAVTTLTERRPQGSDEGLVATSLLITGAFGGSAIYGYRHTADCREAKAQLAERVTRFQQNQWNGRLPMPVDPWQTEGGPPPMLPSPAPATPQPAVPGQSQPDPSGPSAPIAPPAGSRP